MKDVIRIKELERALDKVYKDTTLSWKYRLLNGEEEQFSIDKNEVYFTQRLSGGMIGEKCKRKIWFQYHQSAAPNFSGRMLRLFNFGHVLEQMVLGNLHAIEPTCLSFDEETGKQFSFTAFKNKFVSKLDGILPKGIIGVNGKCILEIKSTSKNSFEKFVKLGVKKNSRKYYWQCQSGMALSKIKQCLFICINKNDSSMYCELVNYDKSEHEKIWGRIKEILAKPFNLPSKAESWCKSCDFIHVCNGDKPLVRCRSCNDYNWKDNTCILTKEDVGYGKACNKHNYCLPWRNSLFT